MDPLAAADDRAVPRLVRAAAGGLAAAGPSDGVPAVRRARVGADAAELIGFPWRANWECGRCLVGRRRPRPSGCGYQRRIVARECLAILGGGRSSRPPFPI